ncbi:MAG: signal peptidase [Frankiaceae bacterium]|nr:signal peptidase [Frankiaceae bacterium]
MSDDAGMTVPTTGGKHRKQPDSGAPQAGGIGPVDDGSAAVPSATLPAEPQPQPEPQSESQSRAESQPESPTPAATATALAAPAATVAARTRKPLSFWQELPLLVALAVVLAVLIKTFAFQAFVIPSESMEKTIMVKDRVMTNKVVYDFRDPHRGEVIVFERTGSWPDLNDTSRPASAVGRAIQSAGKFIGFVPSGTDFIKRVVGLPGDTVACCDAQGHMTVNGKPLIEPYAQGSNVTSSAQLNFKSAVVPKGELFVMGDNREHSSDSRAFGTVPIDKVVGRAVFIMWPSAHWKGLPVPGSVEQFSALPTTGAVVPSAAGAALVLPLGLLRARRRRRFRRTAS